MLENKQPKINFKTFIHLIDEAKKQISKNFDSENYEWFTNYNDFAFDNISFKYKNQIFSIVLDIQIKEGVSYLPREIFDEQISFAKKYNLIPCKFPIIISQDSNKILNKINGFNLYHTETNREIIPNKFITNEDIELSDYELNIFAIKETIKFLNSKNIKILSYSNSPEQLPHIWFLNKYEEQSWLIIKNYKSEKTKTNLDFAKKVAETFKDKDGYLIEFIIKSSDKKFIRTKEVKFELLNFEKIYTNHNDITKEDLRELVLKSVSKYKKKVGFFHIPYYDDYVLKVTRKNSIDNLKNIPYELGIVPFKYEDNIIKNKSLGLHIYHIDNKEAECIKRGYVTPQEIIFRNNSTIDIIRKVSGEVISDKFARLIIRLEIFPETKTIVDLSFRYGRKNIYKAFDLLRENKNIIETNFIEKGSPEIKFISGTVYYKYYTEFISAYLEHLKDIANLPQKTYDNAVKNILSSPDFVFDFTNTNNTFIDYKNEQFNFIDFVFEPDIVNKKTIRQNQLNHFRGVLLGVHINSLYQPSDYIFYPEHIEKFEKYHKILVQKINNIAPDNFKIQYKPIDEYLKSLKYDMQIS